MDILLGVLLFLIFIAIIIRFDKQEKEIAYLKIKLQDILEELKVNKESY